MRNVFSRSLQELGKPVMSTSTTTAVHAAVHASSDDQLWFWMLVTLAVTIAIQMTGFAIAATCKFDTITDILGATNFVVIAAISFFSGPITYSKIVFNAIFCCCRLELGILLLVRVCKRKEDKRFDNIRGHCLKFLIFWIIQIVWAWGTSLPIIYINWADGRQDLSPTEVARLNTKPLQTAPSFSDPLRVVSLVCMCVMLLAFVLQVVADLHKYFFVKNRTSNLDFCSGGLWGLSRHPNYFFEICIWWSLFLGSMPLWPTYPWGVACVFSPLITMLLLLGVSGIPFTEGKKLARYYNDPVYGPKYRKYHNSTSPCIPCCPAVYRKCPNILKLLCCFECPCYQYKEERVSTESSSSEDNKGKFVTVE